MNDIISVMRNLTPTKQDLSKRWHSLIFICFISISIYFSVAFLEVGLRDEVFKHLECSDWLSFWHFMATTTHGDESELIWSVVDGCIAAHLIGVVGPIALIYSSGREREAERERER
jgi:hypothetical protein